MKTKNLLFSILILLVSLTINAQTWYEVGNGGFSNGEAGQQRIAYDGNTMYVAYTDFTNDFKVTVKKYNGTNWETVGQEGFTGQADQMDFVIENGQFFLIYSWINNIYAMTLSGGNWITIGASPFANGSYASLSVFAGVPYVVFEDNNAGYKTSVKKFDGANWVNVGNYGFSPSSNIYITDIEVTSSGIYICYGDEDLDTKLTVMKFDNNTWTVIGTEGFSEYYHQGYNTLAIHNGSPYVVTWKPDTHGAVYRFDGSNWVQVGADITTGEGRDFYLTNSPQGDLYVAFCDLGLNNKAELKKLNNSVWESVGGEISKGNADYLSVAFDNNGVPFVAYKDWWYQRKTTVMTYGQVVNGVNNIENISAVEVYPNPATNMINIQNNHNTAIQKVVVFNQVGQEVYVSTESISSGAVLEIDISNFGTGIFFIQTQSDTETLISKFVKR